MSIRCSSNNCFNPSFPCSPWELVLQLFYSPFLFLDENLRIHRRRAKRTHITPCGFVKVRLMHLFAVRTSYYERLVFFWFCHIDYDFFPLIEAMISRKFSSPASKFSTISTASSSGSGRLSRSAKDLSLIQVMSRLVLSRLIISS